MKSFVTIMLSLCAGCVCAVWLTVFAVHNLHATAITTFDSAGEPFYLEQDIGKDPDKYLQVMENSLRMGRLDLIGGLARRLMDTRGEDPKVPALLSIYLSSEGELDAARAQLEAAQEAGKTPYALYAQAMILRLEKKYSQAKQVCREAISLDESHPYPWNVLGRIQFDQGAAQKAYESFQKAVNLEPGFLPSHTNLGAAAYILGKDQASMQHFQKALEIDPRASNAHFGLGLVYTKSKQHALAAEQFERTLELDPEKDSALEELGPARLKAGQFEKALETGQIMMERNLSGGAMVSAQAALRLGQPQQALEHLQGIPEGNPEAATLAGYSHLVLGQYDKALARMQSVLALNPEHFGAFLVKAGLMFALGQDLDLETHLRLGWGEALDKAVSFSRGCVLASRGEWQAAAESWHSARDLIQGYSMEGLSNQDLSQATVAQELPHLNLGLLLSYRDLTGPALSELKKALAINDTSIMANYWAAQALLKQGKRLEAIDHLEKALEQAPRFFTAQYTVAELHFLNGKPDKALQHYRQALEVREDPGILVKLGLLHENLGQFEQAADSYQRLIDLLPDFFVGYNQLAWLYAKQGVELNKAMQLALKANELQPGNASILDTLGWIHFHKKDYDKALSYLEKSLQVNPQNPTVLYHLGMTHHALDNPSEARSYLERALAISETFEGAQKAKDILNASS